MKFFLENPIFMLLVFMLFLWLGFYFGYYYGEGVYRWCRYKKLKIKRWFQGRHKFNDRIILGK